MDASRSGQRDIEAGETVKNTNYTIIKATLDGDDRRPVIATRRALAYRLEASSGKSKWAKMILGLLIVV